jgi:hypothetical protein
MRFNHWDGAVPAAAWVLLAVAAARLAASGASQDATSLGGSVPFLFFALAVGVVMANRTLWAAAFVLTGIIVTLFGIELGAAAFGLSPSVPPWGMVALDAVQFAALVALHPRWNERWAEATSR